MTVEWSDETSLFSNLNFYSEIGLKKLIDLKSLTQVLQARRL